MEKNTVVINRKIASNTKIVEVNGDIIVPDVKPDIVNVIDTNGTAYIYKEDIVSGRIRLDGNIDTYVVYLADNGENRSIQTTLSLAESIEDSNIKEGCFSKQKVSLENIEAKVLNERKLSIKANVKIKSEIFEKSEIEIISDFNEIENAQKLKETLDIQSVVGRNTVKTAIKEDIAIDNGYDVSEILKVSIDISNLENKISFNKVLAKADCNVKIVFLAEDGRISTVISSIPVMSFVDMDKITDSNVCIVDYTLRNMLFKVNSKEMHSIACQLDFEVACEAYEKKTIDVIQDMYGLKNEIEFSKKTVQVQTNSEERNDIVNINERVLVEDILNIHDVSSNLKIINSNKSGNLYNHECEIGLDIYYEADSRNGLNVKKIVLPFMIRSESETVSELMINRKNFTVSGENVDCNIDISYKQSESGLKAISVIENIETKELPEENDYKIFMYFVKAGDSIWKIAKNFKVCMNDIISINNIENPDKLKIGERLYIMR